MQAKALLTALYLSGRISEDNRRVFLSYSIDELRSKDLEYRRVILRGTFDHAEEIHVFPRSLNEGARGGGGMGRQPKSGGHIITPFEITNTG